jgi:hypothetical protein
MSTTVRRLSEQAAETIRELNHHTRDLEAFTDLTELCWLLADLNTTAQRMPQLLTQLDRWLTHRHRDTPLRTDNNDCPGELVAAVADALTHAARHAHQLAAHIDTAHQHAAHLATA